MRQGIRGGARSGSIMGVVLLFFILIGFTVISSELLAGLLGRDPRRGEGSVAGFLILLVLFGLLAGWLGARRQEPDTWASAAAGGVVAGLIAGLVMAATSLVLTAIEAAELDLWTYLAELSPKAISLYELDLPPPQGAFRQLVLLAGSGLVGGLLARGVGRGAWRSRLAGRLREQWNALFRHPTVERLRARPRVRLAAQLGLIALLFLVPMLVGRFENYTLGTVGIYVLMGLGLNIVVGLAGLLDLGYVAFFAVGAYTAGLLTAPEPFGLQMSFWLVLPIGVIVAALAGVLLGIPVLRLRGDYLAIVTLGFGEIIRILVKSDILADYLGGPQGIRAIGGPTLAGQPFTSEIAYTYLILLGIILVIFVTRRLQDSRVGRAWIAMREDETVARATGVDVYKAKLLAFAIGAAFAGLGGVLFASRNQYTGPGDHNLMVSINVLCLVVVGGMGSIPGVIAGAFVLKGLPEALRELEDYRLLAFGALLVAMMIWRPEGIWPSRRRRLEMHTATDTEEPDQEVPP